MAKRLVVCRKTAIHRKSIYAELSGRHTADKNPIRFFLRNTIEDSAQNEINRRYSGGRRYDTRTYSEIFRLRKTARAGVVQSISRNKGKRSFSFCDKAFYTFRGGDSIDLKPSNTDRSFVKDQRIFSRCFNRN